MGSKEALNSELVRLEQLTFIVLGEAYALLNENFLKLVHSGERPYSRRPSFFG